MAAAMCLAAMWVPPMPRAASSVMISMGDRCSARRALGPLTALRGGGVRHPRKVERLRSGGAAGGLPLSDDGSPRAENEGQMRAASGGGLEGRGARMAQATARRPRRASSHGAHGEQRLAAMPAAADSSNEEMSETGATLGLGAGEALESTPNDEDAVQQQLDRLGRGQAASPPPQWGGDDDAEDSWLCADSALHARKYNAVPVEASEGGGVWLGGVEGVGRRAIGGGPGEGGEEVCVCVCVCVCVSAYVDTNMFEYVCVCMSRIIHSHAYIHSVGRRRPEKRKSSSMTRAWGA